MMMITRWMSVLLMVLSLALAGCGTVAATPGVTPSAVPALPTEMAATPVPTSIPTQGVETQMPMSPATSMPGMPADLNGLVDAARKELATRLSIAASEITTVKAESVVWADSSLGCPEPGMAYSQMLSPGYLVVLSNGGKMYEYHAGGDRVPVFCKNPQAPSAQNPDSI